MLFDREIPYSFKYKKINSVGIYKILQIILDLCKAVGESIA